MKKIILSSVFAGLMVAGASVDAKAKVGVSGDFKGGWLINAYMLGDNNKTAQEARKYKTRHNFVMDKAKIAFNGEMGCNPIRYGVHLSLDATGDDGLGQSDHITAKNSYLFVRGYDAVELRLGALKDATHLKVDTESVLGGFGGVHGSYYKPLISSENNFSGADNKLKNQDYMLTASHANRTGYSNAVELRTTRMNGFQAAVNYKIMPEKVEQQGDPADIEGSAAVNHTLSGALNYDQKFNDWRVRLGGVVVYGVGESEDNSLNLTYRAGGIVSYKTFDLGVAWLDNMNAHRTKESEIISGKWIEAAAGYTFDKVTWKPRVALGGAYSWKGGKKMEESYRTAVVTGTVDLELRDGLRWFFEGDWVAKQDNNKDAKLLDNHTIIFGTGLSIKQ